MSLDISPQGDDDHFPRMMSAALRRRLVARLAAVLAPPLRDAALPAAAVTEERLGALVEAFFELYERRPVRDNQGGSGFNDSLWLYLLSVLLAPKLIIESGVHKGHSTWLFRQAAPQAAIHAFDIDLGRLVYRDATAHYHEGDWLECDLASLDPADSLVFFDDHISHAERICQAHARGFRRLLLDDNFGAEQLYATGGPPVPTLAMILDETLDPSAPLHWRRKGKDYSYGLDRETCEAAKALIARVVPLPELAPLTRYGLGSGLTLVELKAADAQRKEQQ